ncbi:hypothetical protein [Leifsonia sp. TF02-11]|uniref:hypothetical protein n=1 Tax=Leifsonia sp. TF02-11 TaxID=2815212 RepID=UPI001AA17DDE|nr:hypothetical protein [Leifsonia sp. TF02-11]MBO1739670.1 hypothetical protein [Leifsonia sp. TF02-11]
MPVYATNDDYAAWTGTAAPANIAPYLRKASNQVREATELDYYAVDNNGLPTDAAKLQAFNDATCCQAAALIALGVDPLAGGAVVASVKESKSIGTARITFATTDAQAAAAAKKRAAEGLVPDALLILRQARLAKNAVWVIG